jgi:hypothetical protein
MTVGLCVAPSVRGPGTWCSDAGFHEPDRTSDELYPLQTNPFDNSDDLNFTNAPITHLPPEYFYNI